MDSNDQARPEVLKLIMLGDIVGAPGRLAVTQLLPQLREQYRPDLVIVNGENAHNGTGITPEVYRKLKAIGVDGITLGDHVYKKIQISGILQERQDIIRPANLSRHAVGRRWMRLTPGGDDAPADGWRPSLYIITVLGRVFTNLPADDPFATIEQVLEELPDPRPLVLVEIHAETTSEKVAMGWFLDGRVSAVIGSHTHVATADARILPLGTAYITDMGMCGPHESILGRRIDRVLTHMTTAMPAPFDVATGDPRINGVYIEIETNTRRARKIERIER
ncbi:MAG: TIGR00282 family metallophosphoesterase, partial [Phycisphaeraceae bacterium]|nr:TIGR00282 family metallophosphoesterase [Phycisphaeraceae bacterium]